MKKMNTSPISGMQELTPEAQAIFDQLKNTISEVYHNHGFLSIETPIIDRNEILLAKAGGDTEKQIYKVIKTAESEDDADQALRFDHTVPLARYVVEHENELTFPFKVTQIGRNFRGERAQKGRFREFYQCDVDVIGRGSLPIYYDADVIATLLDAFKGFKLGTPVLARINNRKILSGFIEAMGLSELSEKIFGIIDHAEKVPPEATKEAFDELGIEPAKVNQLIKFIGIHGGRASVTQALREFGNLNDTFKKGIEELEKVMLALEMDGRGTDIEADMLIVRGLDYYTGTVFEFVLPEYKQVGSVCGGGRYENLAGFFTEQQLPGVGGSIGLTRLFYVLNENKLIKSQEEKPIDTAVIPITDNEIEFAMKVAKDRRDVGERVTIVAIDKRLGDKLTYAAKLARNGIVVGENEAKTGTYEIKKFN